MKIDPAYIPLIVGVITFVGVAINAAIAWWSANRRLRIDEKALAKQVETPLEIEKRKAAIAAQQERWRVVIGKLRTLSKLASESYESFRELLEHSSIYGLEEYATKSYQVVKAHVAFSDQLDGLKGEIRDKDYELFDGFRSYCFGIFLLLSSDANRRAGLNLSDYLAQAKAKMDKIEDVKDAFLRAKGLSPNFDAVLVEL